MVLRTSALLFVLMSVLAGAHAAPSWVFLEDDVAPPLAIGGTLAITDPSRLDLRLAVCGDSRDELNSYYLIELTGEHCVISRVADGETAMLSDTPVPALPAGPMGFAVHRDGWRIALLLDGMTVAKAWDCALSGTVFGHLAVSGATVTDAYCQEVGEILAADAFEREEGAKDDWTVLSGSWEHVSLREDRQAGQMQADKTTNAFSYSGRAKGGSGLATMGSWWWRNCSYSVAVRCRGTDSAAGLAFYVQDERNLMLLRVANRLNGSRQGPGLALVAVRDGKEEVLAQRTEGVLPDQWYRLRITACDDRVRCYLDDELLFDHERVPFGQGPVGMYVAGADGASFDDLLVGPWDDLKESFAAGALERWESSGQWSVQDGQVLHTGPDDGVLVAGDPQWSALTVAALATGHLAAPGLVAGYQAPDDFYVFRWANSAGPSQVGGRAQLVHVTADGEEPLADEPLPADPPETLAARLELRPGSLIGYLGERMVVTAVPTAPVEGRVGLYVHGGGRATFSAFSVEPLAERRVARVVKEFTDTKEHFEMAEWASTRHAWVLPAEKDPAAQVWWTKGDYYGPLEIRVPLVKVGAVDGKAMISLLGEPGGEPMCQVTVGGAKGTATLSFGVEAMGAQVGSATADAAGEEAELVIAVTGRRVDLSLDGSPVLQVVVPETAADPLRTVPAAG